MVCAPHGLREKKKNDVKWLLAKLIPAKSNFPKRCQADDVGRTTLNICKMIQQGSHHGEAHLVEISGVRQWRSDVVANIKA